MGGCCCSSRRSELNGTPVYYYQCPQALEEREPLSSSLGAVSARSSGFLVDTNLDTSTPDTYRSPPAPIPYDVDLGHSETPPDAHESGEYKIDATVRATDSGTIGETLSGIAFGNLVTCEGLKESDYKIEEDSVLPSPKVSEVEPSKWGESIVSAMEKEDCPICLEEYDVENPRIVTKCEHHFHLSCILEWMERSDTCPVCDQEMILNHTII